MQDHYGWGTWEDQTGIFCDRLIIGRCEGWFAKHWQPAYHSCGLAIQFITAKSNYDPSDKTGSLNCEAELQYMADHSQPTLVIYLQGEGRAKGSDNIVQRFDMSDLRKKETFDAFVEDEIIPWFARNGAKYGL